MLRIAYQVTNFLFRQISIERPQQSIRTDSLLLVLPSATSFIALPTLLFTITMSDTVQPAKSRKGKEREPAQADLFDRLIAIQRSKAASVSLFFSIHSVVMLTSLYYSPSYIVRPVPRKEHQ